MISNDRKALRGAAAAVILALPLYLVPAASADSPALLRGLLDHAQRQAQALRSDIHRVQMPPDAAVRLNRRIDELERLIQRLTDKIDSLDAQQREMAREFERFKNDTEHRLDKGARPPERSPTERRADAAPERRQAAPNRSGDNSDPPRTARPDTDSAAVLPSGPPREQYEHALSLLRRADYRGAEVALLEFVRRHPNDALAANAYYWLGENYFAQSRFQDAAYQFADGYKRFPNHPKAQDNLFKLGLTFARQGKTTEACATFSEFRKRFPTAGLRREAEAEQRRLNCPG